MDAGAFTPARHGIKKDKLGRLPSVPYEKSTGCRALVVLFVNFIIYSLEHNAHFSIVVIFIKFINDCII